MSDDAKNKREISAKIEEYFLKPEKYFDLNFPVSIGHKVKLKDFDSLKSSNLISSKKLRHSITAKSSEISIVSNRNKSPLKSKDKEINSLNKYKKYSIVDNSFVKSIFDSYNKSDNKGMYLRLDTVENNKIPSYINNSLNHQKNTLSLNNSFKLKSSKLSNYISRRINKCEKELLMNKIEFYRYKKGILSELDSDSQSKRPKNPEHLFDKYGAQNWLMSLRRPRCFFGVREGFINVKQRFDPFWARIREKSPKIREDVVNPNYDVEKIGEFKEIRKNKYLAENSLNRMRIFGDLDSLKIKGEKLYDIEYKREVTSGRNNNKILHNMFVDNGKLISYKDVNRLFGEETFYKNYIGPKDEENVMEKNYIYKRLKSGRYGNNESSSGRMSKYGDNSIDSSCDKYMKGKISYTEGNI